MERLLALLLACAAMPAAAQQAPLPAPPVPPTAPVGDDLAFLNQEDRMTVPVRIDAAGPFPFIVDSGARRVEAPALDARDMGAFGILGIDAMQDHALTIDFDQQRMAVIPAAGVKPPRPEPGEIVVRAKSLFGQLVVTNATVAGRRVRVVLDTGTSVSIGNLALRRLLTRRRAGTPIVFTSVTGDSITTDYAAVPMLTLGSATIRALPVGFADARPFAAFGLEDKPALLLGMDVLRLFRRVHIDFARRELRLLLPRDAGRARVL